MQQANMPFYDSAEDATNEAIRRSEKTFQEVAHKVRPELNIDSAYAWLKNALKDGPREKLSSDQHMLIANFCDEYDWLYYHCCGCHHSQHSDKSPKEVAFHLWPHMKPESAYARLMGALKSDRPEKLSADEHICIANFTRQFDYVYYTCAQTYHTRPDPREPVDEAMELDREIDKTLKSVEQLLKRRERIATNLKVANT